MAPITFADAHNMVTFLFKSETSQDFDQIVDFLNSHTIPYALVVNPTIYVSCIKQFWATTTIKKVNDVVQLRVLIDGTKVIVTKDVIRRDLRLDDADGVNAKRTMWNEFSCSMAAAIICLATGGCIQTEGTIKAIDADEDITLVDVETQEETLIQMKAEKEKLLDEQIAQRLHDEEVKKATAREKQEKDDLERAKTKKMHYGINAAGSSFTAACSRLMLLGKVGTTAEVTEEITLSAKANMGYYFIVQQS
nr:hypothetical protein [Tanacetum cinerariifolium]